MANRDHLSRIRTGTVINGISKSHEATLGKSLELVVEKLNAAYDLRFRHLSCVKLVDIVEYLRLQYPSEKYPDPHNTAFMKPDGGILCLVDKDHALFPILVSEVKNQGTNDRRANEGKPLQPKGNAIERLAKNVIGFKALMQKQGIFPFVCFGYGIDFAPGSSILGRVQTVAQFHPLNTTNIETGSFFFRENPWDVDEMEPIMEIN